MNRQRDKSGLRIHIVGTGGQGLILTARLITRFFVQRGQHVLCSQLHGMAQRGGSVQSTVMIDCGDCPVMRTGGADVVLGLEPVETARALTYISSRTLVFMNTVPIIPYILSQQYVLGKKGTKYPDLEELKDAIGAVTRKLYTLNATERAREAGAVKALNMVMLGCLLGTGSLPCTAEEFLDSLKVAAPPNMAEINSRAFSSGVEFGRKVVGSSR